VLDDTRRALTNLTGEVSGRLTLATSHHIGLHRLPPLLREFTHYPKLRWIFSSWIRSCLRRNSPWPRRMAVITLAPEPHSLIRAVPVWDDPLDFVVAPEHNLLSKPA
jgi:DNA-binding transcriptional LysR family regulator